RVDRVEVASDNRTQARRNLAPLHRALGFAPVLRICGRVRRAGYPASSFRLEVQVLASCVTLKLSARLRFLTLVCQPAIAINLLLLSVRINPGLTLVSRRSGSIAPSRLLSSLRIGAARPAHLVAEGFELLRKSGYRFSRLLIFRKQTRRRLKLFLQPFLLHQFAGHLLYLFRLHLSGKLFYRLLKFFGLSDTAQIAGKKFSGLLQLFYIIRG